MRLASTRTTFLRNHGTVKDPSGCMCIYIYTYILYIYYAITVTNTVGDRNTATPGAKLWTSHANSWPPNCTSIALRGVLQTKPQWRRDVQPHVALLGILYIYIVYIYIVYIYMLCIYICCVYIYIVYIYILCIYIYIYCIYILCIYIYILYIYICVMYN